MPVKIVPEANLPKPTRQSKLSETEEYADIKKAIRDGIKHGQVVVVTFGQATAKLFKNEKKACQAFVMRLRREIGDKHKIQTVNGVEIRISNLKK